MSHFVIDGDERPSGEIDIVRELRALDRGRLRVKHGQIDLEVQEVKEGGYWCRIVDKKGPGDALGPPGPGLVNAWDGGGDPVTLRRACALPEALAADVLATFARDGSRSEAVRWGRGVVRDSWGYVWRDPETFLEYPETKDLEETDKGFTFSFVEPFAPEHAQGPVWNAITEVEILCEEALPFLAQHPIEDLRTLLVADSDIPHDAIQAVLDHHPDLEWLTLDAEQAVRLPHLSASRLRTLWLAPYDLSDEEETAQLTRKLHTECRPRWHLPALQTFHVSTGDEDGSEGGPYEDERAHGNGTDAEDESDEEDE